MTDCLIPYRRDAPKTFRLPQTDLVAIVSRIDFFQPLFYTITIGAICLPAKSNYLMLGLTVTLCVCKYQFTTVLVFRTESTSTLRESLQLEVTVHCQSHWKHSLQISDSLLTCIFTSTVLFLSITPVGK